MASHPNDCQLWEMHRPSCWSSKNLADSLSGTAGITLLALIYLATCQIMRFQRSKQISKYVRSHRPLTAATAQPIVIDLGELEFPFTNMKAMEFALFRTYGIPSISALLQKTSLYSQPDTAGERMVDTKILVSEFVGRNWGSEEWVVPMARLNAIHGHYRDKGSILEADMLYTLILFARQVPYWVGRYEWRSLTPEEYEALGCFWQAVSEAMEIQYTGLGLSGWEEDSSPGAPVAANGKGKGTWVDGTDWLKAAEVWSERYEQKYMVPAESNAVLAEQTVSLLLDEVPSFLRPLGRHFVSTLMDDRLRRAMMIEPPPTWVHCTVMTLFKVRKFVLRWLMPPRPDWLRATAITDMNGISKEGRHHITNYENYPYFVEPTLANRWGPRAWQRWFLGRPLPGDAGMRPEGYLPAKVGPPIGKAEAEQTKREHKVEAVLTAQRHGGCPMAFAR